MYVYQLFTERNKNRVNIFFVLTSLASKAHPKHKVAAMTDYKASNTDAAAKKL